MVGNKESNIVNITRNKVNDLAVYILAVLIFIFQTPKLSRNLPNVVLLGLMALFLLLVVNNLLNLSRADFKLLLTLIAYLMLITIYKVLRISSAELYYYFNTVQFFFFMVAGMAIYRSLSLRQMRFLVIIILLTIIVTMIHNVLLFFEHGPNHYVLLFRRDKYAYNVVDTPFTGAILLLSGVTFVCCQNVKKKSSRLMLMLLSFLGILFCVEITQRTIILMLALLMYPLLMFFRVKQKVIRYFLFIIAILVAITMLINYDIVLLWIGDIIGSERVVKRIQQIIVFLETWNLNAAGGSLAARFELIFTSWKTFTNSLMNFLIGVGDHRMDNFLIGNHSQLIDELARYGLFGGIISWSLVFKMLKCMERMAGIEGDPALKRQLSVLGVIVVLRGFLGIIFAAPIGIQMFLGVPLMLRLLQTSSNDRNQMLTRGNEGV